MYVKYSNIEITFSESELFTIIWGLRGHLIHKAKSSHYVTYPDSWEKNECHTESILFQLCNTVGRNDIFETTKKEIEIILKENRSKSEDGDE